MLTTLSSSSSSYDPNAGRVSIEGKPLNSYAANAAAPAVTPSTGKTNAQVLSDSEAAAEKAAATIGGSYTMSGGFSKSPVSTISSKDGESVVNGKILPVITAGNDSAAAATAAKAAAQAASLKASLDTLPSDMTDTSNPNDPVAKLQKEQSDLQTQKDLAFKQQQDTLGQMAIANNAATSSLVQSLQASWDSEKSQQDDANRASSALLTQAGIRSGTARYAPTVQGALQEASRAYGIAKLGSIDALYSGKISEAQTQLQKGNLQLALQAATAANKYLDDASKTLNTMLTAAQKTQDKQFQATRDYAIASLYKQGVTDPEEILSKLSEAAQASGFSGGDFTLKEIGDAITTLSKKEGTVVTQSDGSGNLYGIDKDTGSILWTTHGVTHVTKAAGGGTTPVDGLGKLTPANQNDIAQAGLSTAPAPVQSFFLNTPTTFRDSYQRDVASGKASPPATLDEMVSTYTTWYDANKKGSSGTHDWSSLLGTTSPAQ